MPQLSGKENSTGVMSGDASGGGGAGAQRRPPGVEGGASAEARGDIRTAGRASKAGSGLAQGQCQGVGGAELSLLAEGDSAAGEGTEARPEAPSAAFTVQAWARESCGLGEAA